MGLTLLALVVALAPARAGAQGCSTPPAFAGIATASPANQSGCAIALTWAAATPSCGGTITYSVYRSTTLGFTPGPGDLVASGIAGTSFLDTLSVAANTTYEYVVRADETAASSTVEDANTARARSLPGGPVTASNTIFFDDFDGNRPANPGAYWVPLKTPSAINVVACRSQSTSHALRLGRTDAGCDYSTSYYPPDLDAQLGFGGDGSVLGVDGFDLTSTLGGKLSFRLWYYIEGGYDFAYLYASTVSPTGPWNLLKSWTGYDGPADGAWSLETFDLGSFAGGKVWFMFEMTSDSVVEFPEGVYLDDVKVEATTAACTTIGPPAGLAFATQPAGAVAGSTLAPPVTVRVVDANGDTVPAATSAVTVGIGNNPGNGTLSGTLTAAPSSGVATFPDLSIARAGSGYTLVATSPGLTDAVSAPFAIAAAAPHHLAVAQQPATIAAGQPFAPPVAIEINDAFGNRTTSTAPVGLGFGFDPALGSFLGASWQAATAGLATFPGLSIDKAGNGYTLQATSAGIAGVTTAPFDVIAGAPHHAEFLQEPTDAVIGQPVAPPVSLAVRDAYGNLCTAYAQPLSLLLFDNPGGATLTGATASPVGGVASFPDLSVDALGAGYTLFGGASGLYGAISASFDVRGVGIFADGFEAGKTAAWAWTDPVPLVASTAAAARDEISARVELAPLLLTRLGRRAQPLLTAAGPDGSILARVDIRRAVGGGYELRALAADAGGMRSTDWVPLGAAAASSATVELEWWRAIGGASNGRLVLRLEGRERAVLDGLPDPGAGVATVWAPQTGTPALAP